MNLLDQKLKEKLLLFNNIDKETLADTHSTHVTNPKTKMKQTHRTKGNEDPFSKLSSKQYDFIYSNFTGNNTMKPTPISPPIVQKNSPLKETQIQRRKTPSESHVNMSNQHHHLSRSKSKEKTPPNDAGDRLYNYGFYIKNKIKEQRKAEDKEMHRQMTPKMLARSKKIIRESNTLIEDRLYKSNKTTHSDQVSEDKEKECYTPKLNKKSLLMAEKLEPSSVRLLTRKKRHNKREYKNMSGFNYPYNYQNSINSHSHNQSREHNSTSPTAKNSNCFNELYTKGIETMHKKDQKYKEQKTKNEEEYKQFAYKPKITKNSPVIDNNPNVIRKDNNTNTNNITLSPSQKRDELYKKQCDWKKKLIKQNEKKKEIKEEEISKDCTFKPEIIQKTIPNDEKFILKNINQMNRYVTKRRECIQMKKEYEEYKSKRLGAVDNTNILQPTIPKGFKFETENRSHSRDKKTKRHVNYEMQLIKEQIKHNSLGSNVVPVYNNSKKKTDPQAPFDDQNEEQREIFINAVNTLHYQINNLNI